MKKTFSLSDFDFTLPEELIAQHPAAERSGSRLLDGRADTIADRRFAELPELLLPGDLLYTSQWGGIDGHAAVTADAAAPASLWVQKTRLSS